MMTLNDILDAVEHVMRLERELKGKEAAILAATTFAERGVARRAMEEHKGLLEKHRAFLPDPSTLGTNAAVIRWMATLKVNRAEVAAAVDAAEKAIVTAEEEAKKSAWKRSGQREESKEIVAARAALGRALGAQEMLEEEGAQVEGLWAEVLRLEKAQAEIGAWVARGYEGPRPEAIQQNEAALQEEFMEECDALPLSGRRPYIFVS